MYTEIYAEYGNFVILRAISCTVIQQKAQFKLYFTLSFLN